MYMYIHTYIHTYTCTCTYIHTYIHTHISAFDKFIWHTIGPKNFLCCTVLSLVHLLIGSRCIPNGSIWPTIQNISKTLKHIHTYTSVIYTCAYIHYKTRK